jgi:hypothetical protein
VLKFKNYLVIYLNYLKDSLFVQSELNKTKAAVIYVKETSAFIPTK